MISITYAKLFCHLCRDALHYLGWMFSLGEYHVTLFSAIHNHPDLDNISFFFTVFVEIPSFDIFNLGFPMLDGNGCVVCRYISIAIKLDTQ